MFWYNTALNSQLNVESSGFVNIDFYGYIPAIQLGVCYDRLGDREMAIKYNELASTFKPYSLSVDYNRMYFNPRR